MAQFTILENNFKEDFNQKSSNTCFYLGCDQFWAIACGATLIGIDWGSVGRP
jgi:hypothetical protein